MFIPKIELSVIARDPTESYAPDINETTLRILSLIFEFKIASAVHIARFLGQREGNRYLYTKLRRLWQGELLESLQFHAGTRFGMPIYYLLGKPGLEALARALHCDRLQLKTYPSVTSFLSSGLFQHEAQIVEMASLEAKNNAPNLSITFVGETSSLTRAVRSDRRIEVLTPDYVVSYTLHGSTEIVYSEFERTNKSNAHMVRKIERYVRYLGSGDSPHTTLRLIFQSERMEKAFWFTILLSRAQLAHSIRIVTTNLSLIRSAQDFLEPIYATEQSVKLKREGRVVVDCSERVKLFGFL